MSSSSSSSGSSAGRSDPTGSDASSSTALEEGCTASSSSSSRSSKPARGSFFAFRFPLSSRLSRSSVSGGWCWSLEVGWGGRRVEEDAEEESLGRLNSGEDMTRGNEVGGVPLVVYCIEVTRIWTMMMREGVQETGGSIAFERLLNSYQLSPNLTAKPTSYNSGTTPLFPSLLPPFRTANHPFHCTRLSSLPLSLSHGRRSQRNPRRTYPLPPSLLLSH